MDRHEALLVEREQHQYKQDVLVETWYWPVSILYE